MEISFVLSDNRSVNLIRFLQVPIFTMSPHLLAAVLVRVRCPQCPRLFRLCVYSKFAMRRPTLGLWRRRRHRSCCHSLYRRRLCPAQGRSQTSVHDNDLNSHTNIHHHHLHLNGRFSMWIWSSWDWFPHNYLLLRVSTKLWAFLFSTLRFVTSHLS